jgi:hypothetical protein
MAGMRLPRRPGTSLYDGQTQFNPETRETSIYSEDAGGMVNPAMNALLASGGAIADPANQRINILGGGSSLSDSLGVGTGAGGGGSRPAAPQQAPNTGAIEALIGEIRGGPKGYTPEQTPIVRSGSESMPYEMDAERSAYGAAKERVGQSTQAAMRGLREQMARRGLTGSGIEGEGLTNLFRGGLGELANADRQMVGERAGRAFTAEQANTDREINQRQYNTGSVNRAREYESSDFLARMGLIAQLQRMMY